MRRLYLLFCALLALASTDSVTAQDEGDVEPLDLAAMLISPSDIATPGYGLFFARSWTAEEKALEIADFAGTDPAEERAVLEDAGFVHGHEQVLGVQAEIDFEEPVAAVLIVSYLYQFASAAGAHAAYAHFENGSTSQTGSAEIEGTQQFGDASRISTFTGVDPDSGVPSESIDLSFVDGTLYGGVTITIFDWEAAGMTVGEPDIPFPTADVGPAEALAERLLARIERVQSDGAPELSLAVLRVDDPNGSAPVLDQYTSYGGTVLPFFAESAEDFETRSAEHAGAVAVYEFERQIGNPYYVTRLYAFDSEDAAAAWLAGAPTAAFGAANARYDDVVPVETSEIYGDESYAVSYTYHLGDGEAGDVRGHIIWVQVGNTVARVQADAVSGASLAGVEDLAQTQAACLEAGGICDPIDPPTGLAASR